MGLGVLGLATIAVAACSGIEAYAISDQENLRYIAKQFGAKAMSRSELRNIEANLGDGFADTVISTTNNWQDWEHCLKIVRARGTIGVIGFPYRGENLPTINPLDSQYFYDKQLTHPVHGPRSRGKRL